MHGNGVPKIKRGMYFCWSLLINCWFMFLISCYEIWEVLLVFQVVDAGARSLKMIFQSKLAPKYDLLKEKNMEFFLLLLNSENENVTELAASIITHSCETSTEQKALCDAMVLPRLICLLEGSLGQRDASLDSLATILKNNSEAVSKFVSLNNGRALRAVIELTKDRYPRTRLLACVCLIAIGIASPRHMQELEVKSKLIGILIELLEEPGRTGDEAPFTLAQLIANKEDLQKLAFGVNAVERLCNFLQKAPLTPPAKRFEGILLALAELCSKLESCRSKFLSLQVCYYTRRINLYSRRETSMIDSHGSLVLFHIKLFNLMSHFCLR